MRKNRYRSGYLVVIIAFVFVSGVIIPSAFTQRLQFESFDDLSEDGISQANIVAVTNGGQGVVNTANVEIREGSGRVLISTMPFIEPGTQFSLEKAKETAERITGVSLADKDVIYFVTDTEANLIGGPSAGAAFTVATIAAIEGKQVREDVVITGTIERDGSIGPVGGLKEKLEAASKHGELFLIPDGQEEFVYIEERPVIRRMGMLAVRDTEKIRKSINLADHGEIFGIEVREISKIDDALKYILV